MREKPLGVVLTLLAVLAVGSAPAALVAFDRAATARPQRPALSDKAHLRAQPRPR
jgi:hypothetical protein